MMILYLQVQQN